MKSAKMKGPSSEELEQQRLANEATAKRNADLDREETKRKEDEEARMAALANNRVGVRSLLSGDWAGFSRGGDLRAK